MSGRFFDSNIILYTVDGANAAKQGVAREALRSAVEDGVATISFQVVQEVLNTVTRKFEPRFTREQAKNLLEEILVPLWLVSPSQSLYELGLDLQQRYRYSFYDSLILAAALSSGCDRLYTEDLQDGQRIQGLTIVNPFA
jgi:predicted nucleic acid-binding protein